MSNETKQTLDKPSISLVLPAYNEQEVIAQAIQEADTALSLLTDEYEILVVDDGSKDETAAILDQLSGQYPQLQVLTQPRNLGYGAALRRGFEEASKQLVGFTDSDCQFDLSELNRLVMLSKDYPIVCGYRIDRKDPFLRRFYSSTYNALVRTLLGTQVRDCDCALKLMHRDTLSRLPIATDGFLVNAVLLTKARQQEIPVVEVGVSHRPRAAGESKVSITHIPLVLAALLRFWWNQVMFTEPAKLAKTGWTWKKQLTAALLLLSVGSVALLSNLGYSFFEPDETRYSQIALNMHETGNLLVPKLDGQPYLDKPPLLYWLSEISYRFMGVNEFAARLPTALAALLTVLTTYILGRRLLGDRGAAIGATLLLLSTGFFFASRFVMMDSLLTLFTTVGLLSGAIALNSSRHATPWWALAGVACGLGILTKGPVAGVICVPPLLAVAWLTRNTQVLRPRVAFALLLPMLVISVPWFLAISSKQQEFSSHFFWTHHIERFFHAFNHQQAWWFYIPVLAVALLPASLLLGPLAVYLFGRGKAASETRTLTLRTQQLGTVLLSGVWIVLFFSLSSCKLPAYILPSLPLFCLVFGKMVGDVLKAENDLPLIGEFAQRAHVRALRLATVVGVVAVVAHVAFSDNQQRGLALVFLVLPAMALVWSKRIRSIPLDKACLATAAICLMISAFGFDFVVPQIADWRSVTRAAAVAQGQMQESVPVVFFGGHKYGATFSIPHSEIVEFEIGQMEDFEKYVLEHPKAVVVTNSASADLIRQECRQTLQLVGSTLHSKVYVAESTGENPWQIGQLPNKTLK